VQTLEQKSETRKGKVKVDIFSAAVISSLKPETRNPHQGTSHGGAEAFPDSLLESKLFNPKPKTTNPKTQAPNPDGSLGPYWDGKALEEGRRESGAAGRNRSLNVNRNQGIQRENSLLLTYWSESTSSSR